MNKQEQQGDATHPEMTPEMKKMVAAALAKALAEKVAAPVTPSAAAATPEPSPAPTDDSATQPPPAMGIPGKWGMISAFKACMKRYTKFNGRASRSEFWYLALASFIIVTTLEVLMSLACVICFYGGVGTVIPKALFMVIIMLYNLFMTVPGLALCVRRLHDTGKAWTYLLMYLIPIAGPIILLIALCSPSSPANQYGEAPDMLPGDDEQMPTFIDKLATPLRNPIKTAQIGGITAVALAILGALYFFIFVRTNPMNELYKEGKLAQLDNDWNSPESEQEFNKHVRAYLDNEADITTHPYIANLLALSIQKDFAVPVEIIEELADRGADMNAQSTLMQQNESPWVQAVIKGDVAILDYLAAAGAQKDETDSAGKPILMRAIEKGDSEMLRALVRHGMNPNAIVKQGSIIMYAIEQNKPDMVQLLMELGADINSNAVGGTALDCAYVSNSPESVEILRKANGATTPEILENALYNSIKRGKDSQLKLLLGAGLPLNEGSASHDNYTPLMLAADRGNEEAIKLLLEAGADPKATTKDAQGNDQSALSIAAGKSNLNVRALLGDEKAIKLKELLSNVKKLSIEEAVELLEKCEIIDEFAAGKMVTDWLGNSSYVSTQKNISKNFMYNYKLCKEGQKKIQDFGFPVDIYRCWEVSGSKHLPKEALIAFIIEGSSLNFYYTIDDSQWYALDYAVWNEHTDIAHLLLASGASAKQGRPLFLAAKCGNVEIFKLLQEYGADINAATILKKPNAKNNWLTPLMAAVEKEDANAINFLLQNGADINQVNDLGNTALHIATQNSFCSSEIIELLVKNGADMYKKNNEGKDTYECTNAFGSRIRSVLINLGYKKSAPAQTQITEQPKMEEATASSSGSSSISAEAFEKLTPLYDRLARLKCKEAYSALCQKRLLMLLDRIREGGDINMTTEETKGCAAIHYACSLGSLSITRWLLENGANPNAVTDKGKTPLQCVGSDNRAAIIRLLQQYSAKHMQTGVDSPSSNPKADFAEGLEWAMGSNGRQKNMEKAVACYRRAAERGHAAAQNNLGVCYATGEGVAKDEKEAARWYSKAAEQGDAAAQNNIGYFYENGIGVERDDGEAIKWYRKSAEQGYVAAQIALGQKYEFGRGVVKNEQEAVKWYRKAVEQGNAVAQRLLGVCYYNGVGVAKNEGEAVKLFFKSAEQGDSEAQFNLAVSYYKANNEKEAERWYRKAAEQNYHLAQEMIAECYFNGRLGLEKDSKEAVKWFHRAAEHGNVTALYNLGVCYYSGEGVGKDEAAAIEWFRKAARHGYSEAQNQLTKLGCEW